MAVRVGRKRRPSHGIHLVPPEELTPDKQVSHFKDLQGQLFGRLRVMSRAPNRPGRKVYWNCMCDCGIACEKNSYELRKAVKASCGCAKAEAVRAKMTTHGMRHTPLYYCWKNMMNRCYYEQSINYQRYGGRGIVVCERWHTFDNFLADMRASWVLGLTLDRRDNDGNYEPGNCRWLSQKGQMNNMSRNRYIHTRQGRLTLAELAEAKGIPYKRLHGRLQAGMSLHAALRKERYK